MPKKRTGRPVIVDGGSSQNIYLPARHVAYVDALARRDYVSFSAAVRLLIERDIRANGGNLAEARP